MRIPATEVQVLRSCGTVSNEQRELPAKWPPAITQPLVTHGSGTRCRVLPLEQRPAALHAVACGLFHPIQTWGLSCCRRFLSFFSSCCFSGRFRAGPTAAAGATALPAFSASC